MTNACRWWGVRAGSSAHTISMFAVHILPKALRLKLLAFLVHLLQSTQIEDSVGSFTSSLNAM